MAYWSLFADSASARPGAELKPFEDGSPAKGDTGFIAWVENNRSKVLIEEVDGSKIKLKIDQTSWTANLNGKKIWILEKEA